MSTLPRTADVVVVGGGVVGAALALALARTGQKPVLLEARAYGGAVTGGSLAAIGTHMHGRDEFALLAHAGRLWRAFSAETGDMIELDVCGKMGFIRTPGELSAGRAIVARERGDGARCEMLTPDAARLREPLLQGDILAATYDPDTATVNPFRATRALLGAARAAGAEMFENTPVRRLIAGTGRIEGVKTAAGDRISTPHVVLACGPWSAALAAPLGLYLPITPRQAQCLASIRQRPGTLRQIISSCESEGGVDSGYTQIQQCRSGQILFNTVTAPVPTPPGAENRVGEVPPGFVADSVATLVGLFPSLRALPILRSWVRFEAVTPDALFMAGALPVTGLHVCAGDNGTGFCRAPMLAQFVADAVAGTRHFPAALRDQAARIYDPARFGVGDAA